MSEQETKKSDDSEIFRDNFINGPDLSFWSLKRAEEGRITPVNWKGKSALEISVHKGDKSEKDPRAVETERTEISEDKRNMLEEGKNAEYKFSFGLPADFQVSGNRLVLAQWKQKTDGDESPFLSIRYIDGKVIILVVNEQGERIKFRAPKKEWRDEWHDVIVNYQISNGNGVATVSIDGEEIVNYNGMMGVAREGGLTYFKMGLYRDSVDYTQSVYFADFQRTVES